MSRPAFYLHFYYIYSHYIMYDCSACVYVCTDILGACGGQKRALHFLELGLQTVVSHEPSWESGAGPLQEHRVLLTTDLSFQPLSFILFMA